MRPEPAKVTKVGRSYPRPGKRAPQEQRHLEALIGPMVAAVLVAALAVCIISLLPPK